MPPPRRPPSLLLLLPLLALVAPAARAANKLPTDYKLCKKNDPDVNECLRDAVQKAVNMLKDGIPSLGVPSVDPLSVAAIEIGQGQGPIAITQKFSNITVRGLSDSVLQKAESHLDRYALKFEGTTSNIFEANYELDGRILLLPITGRGRCKLEFTNMQATLEPMGKATEKKGKTYFDVTDFKLTIHGLDKLKVNFENLFNGDKTLGDSMNALLNENWRDLWGELKPAFEETFGAVFQQFTKRIFDKVPVGDIFLE